jgi:CheY-like chemotaxis protein
MPVPQSLSSGQVAMLTRKKAVGSGMPPRVLVAHADRTIGRSLGTLLRNVGFEVVVAQDLDFVNRLLPIWNPDAFVVDTFLEYKENYPFSRSIALDPLYSNFLLIALCHTARASFVEDLRSVGFDAALTGPHQAYPLQSLLLNFFSQQMSSHASHLKQA